MNLDVWMKLAEAGSAGLVSAALEADARSAAAQAGLRRRWHDAELVRAALLLAQARRKAAVKFGARAKEMWADPQGVEMASSLLAGRYKAARLCESGAGGRVVDLCSGIGGDAMAMSEAGLRVLAVDIDPVRAWMSARNAGCESVAMDAESGELPDGAFHLDPARRTADGAKRVFSLAELMPGPKAMAEVVARRGSGAIKLGPGVDAGELPEFAVASELEFISEDGRLTQAVLWVGACASGGNVRTATLLTPEGVTRLRGSADGAAGVPTAAIGAFVHEIDASVERAGLLREMCRETGAAMLHPSLGLITSDRVLAHPMLTAFEVHAEMAWNQKRVREELSRLGAGIVEVKTRGKAVEPDALQRELRGKGERGLVVFVLRFGRELRCIVAERVPGGPPRRMGDE
jgi:THUMP domain-like